ncbi:transglutaminase domain-containing protein [Dactylosporangium sp. NPDC050688]|uniref:transglutaminase family protein n=1 Tax=Dactylosporangium sp. NPDC050688 TaxID=3157217 RepID=UPI0033D175D0
MKPATIAAGTAVVTATVCAALPVTAIYVSGPMPGLLCAAAIGGATVTGLLRASRQSSTAALFGSLMAMGAGILWLGLWLPRPAGSLLAASAEALVHSGARILTSAVPVRPTVETVALPFCATWLAASAGIALLASRRPASAGLAPVLLFVGALAFVGPAPAPAYGCTAVLIAALALLLGVVKGGDVPLGRAAALGAAALSVLLGGATAVMAPALLAGATTYPPDLRTYVVPPYQNPQRINPLSMLSGWAAQPDRSLLEVTTDRPTRLRWVTLPEFTGVTWLPAPAYRAAGSVLPSMAAAGPSLVRQTVGVTGLTGGWLPVPDGVREVHGVRVAVDIGSDTLAAPDGLTTGVRYVVTAQPPVWQADRLALARLPAAAEYDPYRSLPAGAPGRLNELARRAAGTGTPYQQAKALESYLRGEYRFDSKALGGNGYPSLNRFLFEPAGLDGGRGTSEQFATAFAVLARALSIPARVVVGFGPGKPVGGNRYRITAGDALAWPEIYLDGQGWVPFDPTPAGSTADAAASAPLAPEPMPSDEPESAEPSNPVLDDPAVDLNEPDDAATASPIGFLLRTFASAMLSAMLILVAVRWWRGIARLRRGAPAARVLGAWVELRHGLRLAGWAPSATLTVEEVAGLVGSALGSGWRKRAGAVAGTVNAIGFGGAAVAACDADRVADEVRALRRALWQRTSIRRRLTWPIDPRPAWWP